ncbi:MAG: glycine cleavage system protein T [Henriciella sp.]|nr:glycine cleavage system protein T [Henriciella sp.]MBF34452.1 glycine cleavage system protein T [Hyphomonadaceae bacterium]MBK75076.1 glycine cleavage system protein T [Henriciella sp.]PHR80042.1 MAG: glycine cleavage system protein T [Henriciella sp.]
MSKGAMAEQAIDTLRKTPLHAIHEEMGGKMVPFAGYEMPVQFEGVKPEHLWTREHAGLFDVSHMGPCFLYLKEGLGEPGAHEKISALIERLVPSAIATLKPGQGRLTVLLNDEGGILDDLIITRMPDENLAGMLYIVVNGAVKQEDWALIREKLGDEAELQTADDRILVALQGPEAEAVLSPHFPEASELSFMRCAHVQKDGERYMVSRCGYTGEDGFELLLPANETGLAYVRGLLADERVKPIGLGARDSLRLEAGLCLYGHDMDASRTPVEADLQWVIQKSRRERADFPGADRILKQIADGPAEKRVGILPLERAPAREGTEIHVDGEKVGMVTSGGFGPSTDGPVAMGYVRADLAKAGTKIDLMVRGKARAGEVADLPFVKPNYKR